MINPEEEEEREYESPNYFTAKTSKKEKKDKKSKKRSSTGLNASLLSLSPTSSLHSRATPSNNPHHPTTTTTANTATVINNATLNINTNILPTTTTPVSILRRDEQSSINQQGNISLEADRERSVLQAISPPESNGSSSRSLSPGPTLQDFQNVYNANIAAAEQNITKNTNTSSTTTTTNQFSTSATTSSANLPRHEYRIHLDDEDHDVNNNIIELNVGGKHFSTTLETLRKDPGSMLSAMFSGVYKAKKDKHGNYFIDRDGKLFRYILNYLRDGVVDVMTDEQKLRQLLREAQFYNLDGLINHIEETLESMRERSEKKGGQYAVVYLGGYGKSAQIYTKDTVGGFSESCVTLNKLATEGYHIEGVASGANGHYYAVLRSNEPDQSIFKKQPSAQ